MDEGVNDLTGNLRKGLTDVDTYLDSTKGQIDILLKKNYDEFEDKLIKIIDSELWF